jgi:hypothetical protein
MAGRAPLMTPDEVATISAIRSRRNFTHRLFDRDTQFVEDALDWVLEERANGRLVGGPPLTLVLYDFGPSASALGQEVKLHNGEAVPGAIHLCNHSLQRAHLEIDATGLNTVTAHQNMLAQTQQTRRTSITFNPATGAVQVRLACLMLAAPVELTLVAQLAAGWAGNGLIPLPTALNEFHAGMTRQEGMGRIFFDAGSPRSNVRIYYRNAIYLFLKFQIGLRDANGYRISANDREVRVTDKGASTSVAVTAVCPRSADAGVAAAAVGRVLADANDLLVRHSVPTHITCMDCPSPHPADEECATGPLSLRHRHVEAA